jgi:A/G-specific adenine glycosylase
VTVSVQIDAAHVACAQASLLDWYARHGRDLPWRRTRDPYAILVAEVMLQQTQVDRVLPKWDAWLEQFPTLSALAAATRADAIRAWQGLGYNRRAIQLHAIAQQAVAELGGRLPADLSDLERLHGIGRYTAGAIACFAFGQRVSIVETNIRRVLWRVFGGQPDVNALADAVLPQEPQDAYRWNQALMDVGATLCRPRQPLCLACPLVSVCSAPGAPYVATSHPARIAQPFETTERFVRGRILDALRAVEPGASLSWAQLAARVPSRPVTHLKRTSGRMADEGLLTLDVDGLRLPQ